MEKTYFLQWTLLALLLCQSCSSAPNSNGQNAAAVAANQRPRLTLNDLPYDLLYLILSHADLPDYVGVAMLNKKLSAFAATFYLQKYGNIGIDIEVTKRQPDGGKYYVFPYLRRHIIFYDYEFATNFLEAFGGSIRSLWIANHYVTREQSAHINKMANYGAKRLTSLNLDIMKGNTLAQFAQPFERVENVTCDIFEEQIGDNILPFDQLFPQLKFLTLKFNAVWDHTYLDCTLPHLKHVTIIKSSSDPDKETRQIDDFIRKNSHLESIEIVAFAPDYIEFISATLPNLVNLTIRHTEREFPDNYEIAPFENVRDFAYEDTIPHAIDELTFPQLNGSATLFYSEKWFGKILTFFENHQNISKLHLKSTYNFNEDHLTTLTSALPDLVEIKLLSYQIVGEITIKTIIDNHPKLESLIMMCKRGNPDENVGVYQAILDGGNSRWSVKEVRRGTGLVFERLH